jgi:hypothetical protein
MIGRWTAGPAARKTGALAVLIAAPVVGTVVVLASMAGPASAVVHRHAAPSGAVALRTLVARVQVHSGPTFSSRVTARIMRPGTRVKIDCYAEGSRLAGNPIWYRVSKPVLGYITSYYLDSHLDPMAGVARCQAQRFSRTYHVLVPGVHIRFWPTASSARLRTLGRVGTSVTVNCYALGQSIRADRVWYHVTRPMDGFISGSHLNTGRDPAHGIPACW